MSVNKVILIGRIGQDLIPKETPKGSVYYRFSIATEHRSRDREAKVTTDWHSCVAWGKIGDAIAEFKGKGDEIYLEGRLNHWKNKEGGKMTDVVIENFVFIGNKPRAKAETEEPQGEDTPF
jgi:single-strand DNA-binding protein